jgi:hypothetical protein
MELRGGGGRNARREPKANRTERRKRDDAPDPPSLPAPVVLRAVGTVSRRGGRRPAHGLFDSSNILSNFLRRPAEFSICSLELTSIEYSLYAFVQPYKKSALSFKNRIDRIFTRCKKTNMLIVFNIRSYI